MEYPVTLVCGMSGGGTRIVVDLCRHLGVDFGPRLDYSGEDNVLKWPIVDAAQKLGWDRCLEAYDTVSATVNRLSFPTTERLTGFKTPAQTAVLPLMQKLFPNFRIVLVARHPVPLCNKERPFRTLRMTGKVDKNRPYEATAREYRLVNERALKWLQEQQAPHLVVRVEDLVVDRDQQVARLADFLGVENRTWDVELDVQRLSKTGRGMNSEKRQMIWWYASPAANLLFGYEADDYKLMERQNEQHD